jgi:hypothetical protein
MRVQRKAQFLQERQAIHPGHIDIGDHQAANPCPERLGESAGPTGPQLPRADPRECRCLHPDAPKGSSRLFSKKADLVFAGAGVFEATFDGAA